jgi:hypothetical protein
MEQLDQVELSASADTRVSTALPLDEVMAAISGWPTEFLGALARAGSPSGSPKELLDVTDVLIATRAGVSGVRLRPHRESCRAALATLNQLESVAKLWMQAFAAGTPIEAASAAERAQRLLDASIEPIQELVERTARIELIRATTAEELVPALAAAAASAVEADRALPRHGLLAIDRAGHSTFASITGTSDPPDGVGVGLHMISLVVDVTMDRARFLEVARISYEAFAAREDSLRAVVGSNEWAAAHSRANQQSFNVAVASLAVQASASTDQMVVEGLLSAVHRLIEGQARHLLATLLAVAKRRDYVALKRQDLSAVITQVEQAGLGTVLVGLQSPVRNAAAHMDFQVDADEVILNVDHGPSTTYTHAQFLDIALAAQESTLALLAGLTSALAVLAVDERSEDLVASALPADTVLKSVLALVGWSDVVIEHEAAESRILGDGSLGSESLSLVAAIAEWLPASANRLRLSARQDGRDSHLYVDLDALRVWRGLNGTDDAERALLVVMARSTLDGVPFLNAQAVEGWVATHAIEARKLDYAEAVPRLRDLMRLSKLVGRDDLVDPLRAAISALRTAEMSGDRAGLWPRSPR